jgi:hypothetical protein
LRQSAERSAGEQGSSAGTRRRRDRGTPPDIEAQRMAAAKNLNLKVFNKDGQQLFCRSNLVTGSHIQRDTRCYTAEQLENLEREVQRQADEFLVAPNSQNPAKLPSGK